MRTVFLHPSAMWGLLLLPALHFFNGRFTRFPSVVIPNVSLLRKIVPTPGRSRIDLPRHLRFLSIALLVVATAEPLIIREQSVVRCSQYAVIISLICFLVEMFLKNTLHNGIP
jgi:hypothetical protein